MASLHAKINQLMEKQKKTAVDISKATGLNKNTIYSIVQGDTVSPTAHTLHLIAQALGVSLDSILIDDLDIEELEAKLEKPLTSNEMKTYAESAALTINAVLTRNINLPLHKLTSLIKKVFKEALKEDPPIIYTRFIEYQLDKLEH